MDIQSSNNKLVTLADLKQHSSRSDCWVAVHSQVWDITHFLDVHPGGAAVLLKLAGSNATQEFDAVHAPDMLEELPKEKFIGYLEGPSTDVPASGVVPNAGEAINEMPGSGKLEIPPLDTILSANDFSLVAQTHLTPKTWAFYSSAATDLITHTKNKELLRRVMIRPRVLRDVTEVDIRRNILGIKSTAPFFISPTAMAKLAHPDGELAVSRAAANEGIIQCVSNNASYTLRSIVSAAPAGHPFFLQLYVNSDRPKTVELLHSARSLGIRAVFVTVDAPVPGKREADERAAQAVTVRSAISGGESSKDKKGSGLGRLMAQYIDKSLTWKDLSWIREACGAPVILKGVQTAQDAILAAQYGADGILLSNHGGRSLDGVQPAILILLELRKQCPEIFQKLEVYVDGGFERGSDILKAIALGATAVGIGRPFLYSLTYGQEGAEHLSQILKDELEVSMRLCGVRNLDEVTPDLVNTLDIDYLVTAGTNPGPSPATRRELSRL